MLALGIRFADKDYYSSEEKIQKKKISTNNICQNATANGETQPSQSKCQSNLALRSSKPRLDRVEQRRVQYNQ
jgi:hypothetical protein